MKFLYIFLAFMLVFGLSHPTYLVNVSHSIHDLSVPYEGLTLKWVFHSVIQVESLKEEREKTYVYKYVKELSPTIFQAKELSPEQETYEINIASRQILTGKEAGNFTSHWIPTNVSVGDIVTIKVHDFMVVSTEEQVRLQSIRDAVVTCIKIERTEPFRDELEAVTSLYFDKNTGLKVKAGIHAEGYIEGFYEKAVIEVFLTETGIDNDGDGLTDYEELFITLTNPLEIDTDRNGINDYGEDSDGDGISDGEELSRETNPLAIDSDGDFWSDSIDFMPTSPFMPNSLIVALIFVPIAIVIWRKKLRHLGRKKEEFEKACTLSKSLQLTSANKVYLFWKERQSNN